MYLCVVMRDTISTLFVFMTLLLWGGVVAYGQPKTFTIAVRIDINMEGGVNPGKIEVTQEQSLSFGNVLRIPSGTNQVTITPSATPDVNVTQGSTLLTRDAMRAGKFKIDGEPNYAVQVTLSSSSINLTQGGNTIPLSLTLSNSSLVLGNNGTNYFYVGGTATYTANKPRGAYTGTFNVTVNYN